MLQYNHLFIDNPNNIKGVKSLFLQSAKLIFISFIFFISSCASFEKNELPRSSLITTSNTSNLLNKPTAYVDLTFYSGQPDNTNTKQYASMKRVMPIIKNTIDQSSIFKSISFDKNQSQNVDYTIKIDIYNHGDDFAVISGFISGLSLGIIPGTATDNFTLDLSIIDRSGNIIKKLRNKDSIQSWIGIWFLPSTSNTFEKALNNTIENQITFALNKLIETKILKQ